MYKSRYLRPIGIEDLELLILQCQRRLLRGPTFPKNDSGDFRETEVEYLTRVALWGAHIQNLINAAHHQMEVIGYDA